MKFARRYLFKGGGMKHIINPPHGIRYTLQVTDIANVELQLFVVELFAHVVLLFFITTEYSDL